MTTLRRRTMLGTSALAAALAAGFAAVGLAAADAAPGPASDQITIDNFTFTPSSLTIKAGTTVTWTNRDDIPHTVVTQDRRVKSGPLDTDDKFTFTFDMPGTYVYFCSIHPHMTGTIVVTR